MGYRKGGFLGFFCYWCCASRMGRWEKAKLTYQTRLHRTHRPNSQHRARICKLLGVGRAPEHSTLEADSPKALFPFPLLHSRGTLASLAPQRKPRLEPGAGITHTAQGGFAWLPGGQVSRGRSVFPPASPASPSFLDLIWVPHTLFPAQPRILLSDFASTFPGHAGQGAASSVPPTALATPGAPGGPPPAPCAAFPRGLSACPATGAVASPLQN